MSNFLNLKALLRLAMIFVAGLSVACGKVQFEERTAISDPPQGGFGTLRLTSATFPEGAESLTLAIVDLGSHFDDCNMIQPLPDQQSKEQVVEGLGLSKIPRPDVWRKCIPSTYSAEANTNTLDELAKGVRVIHVQRGQEITPIRLRTGSYQITADFFDKSNELLYTGSEFFDVQDGEQKSISIRLKKVESGEVTIGFEVEKPEARPTRISEDAHIELRRTAGFVVQKGYLEKNIELNLAKGVAVISAKCLDPRALNCKGAIDAKKVELTRTAIRKILAITSSVGLKNSENDQVCIDPVEHIALILKKCQECEAGKQYKFSNTACGTPYHNLTSQQFDQIWTAIHSDVVRVK